MAKKQIEEKINLDSILFKCRDILRQARNSGSFFEKRDMMLTLVFLRFIGEKFEDGVERLRLDLIKEGFDPDDEAIKIAFLDDPTFTDGTYNLLPEARWSTIINTPAPQLNVALDTALHSIATNSKQLKGCFVEGTFTTRNLAPNDIKKVVDEDLISKKELLERYGISYGALYRWKRMGLIPESWFLRRSTPSGQETYFHTKQICLRVERILESKERVSLEELAAELAGQKQAAAARRTLVLETKYGPKTYPLDELLHLYLTEGEHKTDILEQLKEEAL